MRWLIFCLLEEAHALSSHIYGEDETGGEEVMPAGGVNEFFGQALTCLTPHPGPLPVEGRGRRQWEWLSGSTPYPGHRGIHCSPRLRPLPVAGRGRRREEPLSCLTHY